MVKPVSITTSQEVTMPVIKNYKADLKGKYRITIKIALILSLSIIIAAFKFFPQIGEKEWITSQFQDVITIEDVINTVQKHKLPKPPERPQIIEAIDEVPEDIVLSDVSLDLNAVLDKPPALPDRQKVIEDEPFFNWAEEMPQPIGGLKAIQEKVVYTEIAKRMDLEGKVIVEAWIDKEGNVTEAFILKDIGGGLGEEALYAVLETKFFPGKQRGNPVNVKMVIPIKFVLR
jgi:protein TonB